MTKILAIDFSTTNTGYAFRSPETGEYIVGAISGGKDKSYLERTKVIAEGIGKLVIEYGLYDYFIAIEEPIITMKTKSTMNLIRANGFFLGYMFTKFNMGYVDAPNSKWASYHFIKGKRPERKAQSIAILESYDIIKDKKVNDDMADAFCILLYMDSMEI